MQIFMVGTAPKELEQQLCRMGHTTVGDPAQAEALLYDGNRFPEEQVRLSGALLVPIRGKSAEEIGKILQTRLYRPLFEEKYF